MSKHTLPSEPTIAELQAIENEGIEPLSDADIDYILENAEIDIELDTFNPFFDDYDF